jgi:hypothetical protein
MKGFKLDEQAVNNFFANFDKEREMHKVKEKDLSYIQNIKEYWKANQENDIYLYYPLFKLTEVVNNNDVFLFKIKVENDFKYHNHQYLKGDKDAFNPANLLRDNPIGIIMGDKNKDKLLTKYEKIETIEKTVVKTETKIVKQDVKKGISKKELEKVKEKTLYLAKKETDNLTYQVIEKYLNQFINLV